MALISCPDCNTQVSDRAPACPKCGGPIAARSDTVAVGTPLTTTQQTSKRLKGQIVASSICFWLGVLSLFNHKPGEPSAGVLLGPLLLLVGLIWYFVTKSRIWWHHK